MTRRYTEEMQIFIAENVEGRTVLELAEIVSSRFPELGEVTEKQMKSYKNHHGLKSGTRKGKQRGYTVRYPQEMLEYVRTNAAGVSNQEMTERCNQLFGVNMTVDKMKSFKSNHGISSGMTGWFEKGHVSHNKGKKMPLHPNAARHTFKKGNIPHNFLEVGTLTVTTDGYLIRKVANPNEWELEARLVWKAHHGEISEGHKIIYLDGDKQNVDISNLAMVSDAEHLEMTRRKMRFKNPELTKAGVAVAKLTTATKKAKKRREKDEC